MILPTKHIPTSQSLLGIGGTILEHLRSGKTVTRLWDDCRRQSETMTFNRFIIALDLLYAIGGVEFVDGVLRKVER